MVVRRSHHRALLVVATDAADVAAATTTTTCPRGLGGVWLRRQQQRPVLERLSMPECVGRKDGVGEGGGRATQRAWRLRPWHCL